MHRRSELPDAWKTPADAHAAMQDGRTAGILGLPRDCNPQEENTSLHKRWDEGWCRGAGEDGFAKNIRLLRDDLDLNQQEFGRRVGVSQMTVSHWETGRRMPRLRTLQAVAAALGITVGQLLGQPEPEKRK